MGTGRVCEGRVAQAHACCVCYSCIVCMTRGPPGDTSSNSRWSTGIQAVAAGGPQGHTGSSGRWLTW